MNTIQWVTDNLHIDFFIVLIVLSAGFFQNRYLSVWEITKDQKTAGALRTLIVSFIAAGIYLWFLNPGKDTFANYFVSYFATTSLYELLVRPFMKWIKKSEQ